MRKLRHWFYVDFERDDAPNYRFPAFRCFFVLQVRLDQSLRRHFAEGEPKYVVIDPITGKILDRRRGDEANNEAIRFVRVSKPVALQGKPLVVKQGLALHREHEQPGAFKLADIDLCTFENEVRALHLFSGHPNIVNFHGWFIEEDAEWRRFMLVLDCVFVGQYGGAFVCDLEQALEHCEELKVGSQFSSELRLKIANDICRALGLLHAQGFAHNDIKPANIFVESLSPFEKVAAVLGDFGLSGASHDLRSQGTLYYMAPELHGIYRDQFHEADSTDRKIGDSRQMACDIYALGIVLYELFTNTKIIDAVECCPGERPDESTFPNIAWCDILTRRFASPCPLDIKTRSDGKPIIWKEFEGDLLDGDRQQVRLVLVKMIRRCLHWDAVERPNIKEVSECLLSVTDVVLLNHPSTRGRNDALTNRDTALRRTMDNRRLSLGYAQRQRHAAGVAAASNDDNMHLSPTPLGGVVSGNDSASSSTSLLYLCSLFVHNAPCGGSMRSHNDFLDYLRGGSFAGQYAPISAQALRASISLHRSSSSRRTLHSGNVPSVVAEQQFIVMSYALSTLGKDVSFERLRKDSFKWLKKRFAGPLRNLIRYVSPCPSGFVAASLNAAASSSAAAATHDEANDNSVDDRQARGKSKTKRRFGGRVSLKSCSLGQFVEHFASHSFSKYIKRGRGDLFSLIAIASMYRVRILVLTASTAPHLLHGIRVNPFGGDCDPSSATVQIGLGPLYNYYCLEEVR
jgi:serine/threonine protein kinase